MWRRRRRCPLPAIPRRLRRADLFLRRLPAGCVVVVVLAGLASADIHRVEDHAHDPRTHGGELAHCALRAAQIFAEERGLDPTDEREALMDLLTRRWRSARPVLTGQQLAQAELIMTQYTGLWKQPGLVPQT